MKEINPSQHSFARRFSQIKPQIFTDENRFLFLILHFSFSIP